MTFRTKSFLAILQNGRQFGQCGLMHEIFQNHIGDQLAQNIVHHLHQEECSNKNGICCQRAICQRLVNNESICFFYFLNFLQY